MLHIKNAATFMLILVIFLFHKQQPLATRSTLRLSDYCRSDLTLKGSFGNVRTQDISGSRRCSLLEAQPQSTHLFFFVRKIARLQNQLNAYTL